MARDGITNEVAPIWIKPGAGDFEEFKSEVSRTTSPEDYPLAMAIQQNIPIYDGAFVRAQADTAKSRRALSTEWVRVFGAGPGVIVIKGAMEDTSVVDKATVVFERLIEDEREAGAGGGDHFAKPGANDRVWNAAEKHCLADPANFAAYFASDALALASETWLGPGYQVTAQVNRVNPGGAAQKPHRDYHLGFMAPEQVTAYPSHVHALSPALTLQGAIAHCDMPLESGPTALLPYSQRLLDGYVSFDRPEYQDYFDKHHAQLPLSKGDMVFFNPALMHGAGTNQTKNVHRMANLLQVSSAFGRAIESVNRMAMVEALYPALMASGLSERGVANAVTACAEGYPFPTNLDNDPPVGGLAPRSQAERMLESLNSGVSEDDFLAEMVAWESRRRP